MQLRKAEAFGVFDDHQAGVGYVHAYFDDGGRDQQLQFTCLELRGPGEKLGTRQSGLLQFKVADLMRDADLLPAVRDAAQALLERWSDHVSPLLDRWLRHGQQYGQV